MLICNLNYREQDKGVYREQDKGVVMEDSVNNNY